MRAVPAIDLARPTSVCCIAVLSSLGQFASLYLLVERGIGRSTRTGYFFEVSAKLQGRVGFFGLAVMFCSCSGWIVNHSDRKQSGRPSAADFPDCPCRASEPRRRWRATLVGAFQHASLELQP